MLIETPEEYSQQDAGKKMKKILTYTKYKPAECCPRWGIWLENHIKVYKKSKKRKSEQPLGVFLPPVIGFPLRWMHVVGRWLKLHWLMLSVNQQENRRSAQ